MKHKKIHMIGIGGIGMSGLASILADYGHDITGSDIEENNITSALRTKYIDVEIGHKHSNVNNQDLIVYSSCIKNNNPEIIAGRTKKIPIISRIELLKKVIEKHDRSIAVTGTHGKTTITAMTSLLMELAGLDPTVLIGGETVHFKGNAKFSKGKLLVTEVDESDGRFVILKSTHIIIPNIEIEHPERYKSEDELFNAFKTFFNNQSKKSMLFYREEDQTLKKLLKKYKGKSFSFGLTKKSDLYACNIKAGNFKTEFDCFYYKKRLGHFTINIPGLHNVLNALSVILLGIKFNIRLDVIRKAVSEYKGVKRRFEVVGEINGATIIEDYAHHPTEIKATMEAASSLNPKRIISVFQPHRYTRTKRFFKEFSDSFNGSSEVILTEVYSASEDKIQGASTESIYELMVKNNNIPVKLLAKKKIPSYIRKKAKKGDLILILGAGDIGKTAWEIKEKDRLPNLQGKVIFNEPISKHTTFRIGGKCKMWIEPKNESDLRKILKYAKSKNENLFIIGTGSNILAKDEGFDGIILNLVNKNFQKISIKNKTIHVGSGAKLGRLINLTCEKGLSGLEGLIGIPGTAGGALFMNAGYKRNISDFVKAIKVMNKKDGTVKILKRKDVKFGYRHSDLDMFIILDITFQLKNKKRELLLKKKEYLLKLKRKGQPLSSNSAGCVFKNPKGKITAAKCIDKLGLKGKRINDAEVSKKHANFIINKKNAKAKDILKLMNFMKRKVKSELGVTLKPEIKII